MKITKTEHKDVGSKPRQNPTKGKSQTSPLLIESDQSDISKTQDQDCHKDPSQPSFKSPPTKPKSTKVNTDQILSNMIKTQKFRLVISHSCPRAFVRVKRNKPRNVNSLSFDLSPLFFDFAIFLLLFGTEINVLRE